MGKSEGICELCGHHVGLRQKAHIVAEGPKRGANVLMLCPSCHVMFDTRVKPKIQKALGGLERDKKIQVADLKESGRKRRKATFPEDCVVTFR